MTGSIHYHFSFLSFCLVLFSMLFSFFLSLLSPSLLSPSFCPFVSIYINVCVSLSICQLHHLSCLSVSLPVCLFVCLPDFLSLFIWLPVSPSASPHNIFTLSPSPGLLPLSLAISLFICYYIYNFLGLSLSLFESLSSCLSSATFFYLSLSLSASLSLSISLSASLSIYLSHSLTLCLSIYLSHRSLLPHMECDRGSVTILQKKY